MKKSLLALSAAAIALSGMAAAPRQMKEQKLQVSKAQFAKTTDIKPLGSLRVVDTPAPMRKAPAKVASADDVIYSAEGTRQNITLTASGYYLFWGMFLSDYADEEVASHLVFGENNEVYLFNPIPFMNTDTYIKGVKEGDKISFEFPQTIEWYDEYDDGYQVGLYDYYEFEEEDEETGEPETYYSYAPSEKTTLTFTVAEDGSMVADDLAWDGSILAAGVCSSGGWSGYGVYDMSAVNFDEVEVTAPDDIEVSPDFYSYVCPYLGYGWSMNIAQGGEEIYFQGFGDTMPKAWLKSTIEYGDTEAVVSIPQNQYLGVYSGYYIYTKAAEVLYDEEEDYFYYEFLPDDQPFQMVWDYEENTMKPVDPNISLLFNVAKDEVGYIQELYEFVLIHQDSFEGTPQDPINLEFDEDWGELSFDVPAFSTGDEVLKTDDLYYVIYVDGEEWEFSPEDYDIAEEMVEIPWAFDCDDIMNFGGTFRVVVFYVEGISSIGVQSVYKYNGEETRSGIVTYDIETGTVAVGTVDADKKVASVKYYGLDGREVANPAAGIFVKRVIFEDGSVATYKKAIR